MFMFFVKIFLLAICKKYNRRISKIRRTPSLGYMYICGRLMVEWISVLKDLKDLKWEDHDKG